jgi:hypothetical protein
MPTFVFSLISYPPLSPDKSVLSASETDTPHDGKMCERCKLNSDVLSVGGKKLRCMRERHNPRRYAAAIISLPL